MARFHPAEFPPELKGDRGGAAELAVWERLADELGEGYTVFHRARWLDAPGKGPPQDGECDFLIAHPARGALVLEVKGGRVRVDPATGRWVSEDRDGVRHDIRDPFDQANNTRHVLTRKILATPQWKGRKVTMGHAVALPHCVKGDASVSEFSRDVTLDADDLTRAGEAIERLFTAVWKLQPDSFWRNHGVPTLERLFVHRDFARIPIGTSIRQEEPVLVELTREQSRLLDTLRNIRRARIAGCAGSGKTMLAVEKARRLAQQGYRVLITCFNRALADFIRAQLPLPPPRRGTASAQGQMDLFGGSRVEVHSFHALAGSWARRAQIELPDDSDEASRRELFDAALPEALLRATEAIADRYDAIIVDEGQDIREEWWVAIQALLDDPDHGVLYVFYDDNQSLYTPGAALPITDPPYLLTRNCRTTRAIHQWIAEFYAGDAEPEPAGPPGRPPVIHRYRDDHELRDQVRRTLHQMIVEEKVPERDIVVLSPHGRHTSALWRDPRFGNLRLTDHWPPAPNHVQCTTVHAFKGLERPVVVLAEVDESNSRPEVLYVGGSRAKAHLVVIEKEPAPVS